MTITNKSESVSDLQAANLRAVIDIGSTAMRMVIAQEQGGKVVVLERLYREVLIGKDTFSCGEISPAVIEDCVAILREWVDIVRNYGINAKTALRVVATTAVREARNKSEFLDRVFMSTGIEIDVLDGADVNRLTFFAVRPVIDSDRKLKKGNLLIIEIGGGSTEVLSLANGRVVQSSVFRMGAYRIREQSFGNSVSGGVTDSMYLSEIRKVSRGLFAHLGQRDNQDILFIGQEAVFAYLCINGSGLEAERAGVIDVKELKKLAGRIASISTEEIVRRYNMLFSSAEALPPALMGMVELARVFGVEKVYISQSTMTDGLLHEMVQAQTWSPEFLDCLYNSAMTVGDKYKFDRVHAGNVAEFCRVMFRLLAGEHKLDQRYEGILAAAALLHDIGTFISNRSHHKHSGYLIKNSDIFGLGERDLSLVATVARYHRRATPQPIHSDYNSMPRKDQMIAKQLASILRVADALDRSRQLTPSDFEFRLSGGRLTVFISTSQGVTEERLALAAKAGMFESIYGIKVSLRKRMRALSDEEE